MKASQILELLKQKHHEDVFIPECKDGPTQGATHLRLDAWVMRKSWSHMACIGYEIKVSRSDFLNDNKWNFYLELCNEFSFCCPQGLIYPEELPLNIGLYYVSKTGNRLMCKRKPVFRNVKIPESLFMYILMCRTTIVGELNRPVSKKEYWDEWLKNKQLDWSFGQKVSKSIKEEVEKKIDEVQRENEQLKALTDKVTETVEKFKIAGIDIKKLSQWSLDRAIEEKIKEINTSIPDGLEFELNKAQFALGAIMKSFNIPQKSGNNL